LNKVLKQLDHCQRQDSGSPEVAAVLAPVRFARHKWNGGPAGLAVPVTYTIPHYPVHLIDLVQMAGVTRVIIRPTLPQVAQLQRDFFRAVSAESRYNRFRTPLTELPEELARRFSSIDCTSHIALLAEVFVGGRQTMIGEARYVVDPCDPATGEFAIAIAEVWRVRGLARILLERLERQAAASGIKRLVADTLRANRTMIGLAAHAGYNVRASRDDARLARLENCLAPPASPLPS